MARIAFLFIFLFSLSAGSNLFSQNLKVNLNGYNKFYYPNGTLASEGSMKEGKPDGFWRTYFPNGVMKSEGNRKQFELDSTWVFYNEKADTLEKINYVLGVKNGYHIIFDETNDSTKNNDIKSKELYVNGLKQGKSFYYQNGKLKKEMSFLDNLPNGVATEYDEAGNPITIIRYKRGYISDKEIINRRDRNGLKQGVWKIFYPSGKLKSQANYKNDLLEGYYKQFDSYGKQIINQLYSKGEKVVIVAPKNEEKIEVIKEFFANGKVKKAGAYTKEKKPVGVHREFNENGKVINAKSYTSDGRLKSVGIVKENGNREGEWQNFYSTTKVSSKGKYEKGRRQGKWDFFFEDGKVEQTGSYYYGKLHGKWIWYYPNGNIWRIENFNKGKEQGEYIEYAQDSTILIQGEYLDGEKVGHWKYNIGDFIEEGDYQFDHKNGIWKSYFPSGKLKFEGQFNLGEARGRHVFYYEQGMIQVDGNYSRGEPDGLWRWFDSLGNETMSITYDRGEKIKIDGVDIDLSKKK